MLYQQRQSHLPPWFAMATPPTHSGLPPIEPLAPNPRFATQPAAQRTPGKRQTRSGPQARRASKRETHTKLVQAAQEQPRDSVGRFAEKGNWFSHLLDPTPRAPTSLKPLKQTGQQRHPITAPPKARISKRKRKKPVPERGMIGRIIAFFTGDYTRWRTKNLREQARLQAQIDGYALPPKKRVQRRRKLHSTRPVQPSRKRGIIRRILGF